MRALFGEAWALQHRRRRRYLFILLLACAAAAVGAQLATRPTGSSPSAAAGTAPLRAFGGVFPGAPRTQPNGYGVESDACPLAAPNPYLPRWSGCVKVRTIDLTGDGTPDLLLVYSRLSRAHPSWPGAPASLRKMYEATQAELSVVAADGARVTAPIDGARAAAILTIASVSNDPGKEIFLVDSWISSGATAVAYGYQNGRLVPADVLLSYGGDSADKAGFDCIAGAHPGLIQRTFTLIGPTIHGYWKETDRSYAWKGTRLVKTGERTFKHRGLPTERQIGDGAGCPTGLY
ncbi:MAG: hypothetical protein ABSC56_10975 [Solirubrobacteraceae bacterium]